MPVLIHNGAQLIDNFDYSKIESDQLLKVTNISEFNPTFGLEKLEICKDNKNSVLESSKEVQNSLRCLYVGQRESATVKFDDPVIDVIGSDDATTCHIVLIVDEQNGNCSMCHFDDHDMQNGLAKMVNKLGGLRGDGVDKSAPYSLYIAGGFDDDRNSSINLTKKLFRLFVNAPPIFHLKLCVVTKLNDRYNPETDTHYPIIYGLGYDIKLRKVFKCNRFIDKGPDLAARSAKHFSENSVMDIYDTENHRLVIGPFEVRPFRYIEQVIRLPNSFILENFSTSPLQEPAEFAENVRSAFEFMIANPKLLETYFINGQPRIYTKHSDGSWTRV